MARQYGTKPQAETFVLSKELPKARTPENGFIRGVQAYRVGGEDDVLAVLEVAGGRFAVPPLPAKLCVMFPEGVIGDVIADVPKFDGVAIVVTVIYDNVTAIN